MEPYICNLHGRLLEVELDTPLVTRSKIGSWSADPPAAFLLALGVD